MDYITGKEHSTAIYSEQWSLFSQFGKKRALSNKIFNLKNGEIYFPCHLLWVIQEGFMKLTIKIFIYFDMVLFRHIWMHLESIACVTNEQRCTTSLHFLFENWRSFLQLLRRICSWINFPRMVCSIGVNFLKTPPRKN